jgi:protein TonB
MKTEHGVSKSWDDLVFENKNKEYGAYTVRKSYSQNLTTGLGISVSFACMLLIVPKIMSALFPGQTIVPDITDKILNEKVVDILPPPTIEPPVRVTPPPTQVQTNFPPAVTTEPVTTDIPTNEDIVANMDAISTDDGVVPGPPAPVVVEPAPPAEPAEFINAEVMPAYKGGLQAAYTLIGRKLKYPYAAQRTGVEGTVFVTFVINKEGKVTNVSVLKGISEECDKEAMRVINLLDQWTPGSQNHRPVNVRMTIPIKFQLEK